MVARCNRHKVRFLSMSCFPVDLQHVMVKRKPVFSMHPEAGTFSCKTAFVKRPYIRRIHSEHQLESWKTSKNHKFSLKVPSALHVSRAAHQVTRHTLALAFLYARVVLDSFFRADSTLTHMTIQVTQLRLNSNPKFANLTQLWLNSKSKFTNLTQLWLNSFESELSQIWLTTYHILPNLTKLLTGGGGGAVECSCRAL